MIHVECISKRYQLGVERHDTLSETLQHQIRRLFSSRHALREAKTHFWALKEVSFDVEEGEVVGIIGRNGAGKSTLLKILSRITPPTEGRIRLRGRVASLLEVGTGFHPELTGRENVFMNGAILGMTRAEMKAKFDEIVAFSEVEKFIDTPVKHYSSGMYVRLAFAVAAHLEPEILVVDEVLAVGDVAFQKKCLGKMGDVAKRGRTVLFVSHNMASVEELCSRAILIQKGCMVLDADPFSVISGYYRDIHQGMEGGAAYQINRGLLKKAESEGFRITDVQMFSLSGDPLEKFQTGDGLLLRIAYESEANFRSPVFRVQLKSNSGQEIFRVNTRPISGYTIEALGEKGHVTLKLDALPLTAGEYWFNVGFARERGPWVVRLEDVAILSVGPRDVYGSGMPVYSNKGAIVLPHQWEHHPERC